jgi:hypothetical protein
MSGNICIRANIDRQVADIQIAITLLFLIGFKNVKMCWILYHFLFPTVPEHCSVYRIKRSATVYYQAAEDIFKIYLNIQSLKIAIASPFLVGLKKY